MGMGTLQKPGDNLGRNRVIMAVLLFIEAFLKISVSAPFLLLGAIGSLIALFGGSLGEGAPVEGGNVKGFAGIIAVILLYILIFIGINAAAGWVLLKRRSYAWLFCLFASVISLIFTVALIVCWIMRPEYATIASMFVLPVMPILATYGLFVSIKAKNN